MLKLKPDVLERNHLDGYQVYSSEREPSYQHVVVSDKDMDGSAHIIGASAEKLQKSHQMMSSFSSHPYSYEVEENVSEVIQSHSEGIIHTLPEDPVGVREVVVGDVEESEVPYDVNPSISETQSEADEGQYTNPPSIATSTKSTEQLILPEENGSVFFGQETPSHSKENVVVERIEYEMPVIKQEIIEPEVEPEQGYHHQPEEEEEVEEAGYNSETVPALDAYQQFNVVSMAKPPYIAPQRNPSTKKTGEKKPRKRKANAMPVTLDAVGMQPISRAKLPPLPPIQIPKLPHNFTPPIHMLPQMMYAPQARVTRIMMKHPTISSLLLCPPGQIMAHPMSHSSPIPFTIPRLHNIPAISDSHSSPANARRRKSKPKQRKPVVSVKLEPPLPTELPADTVCSAPTALNISEQLQQENDNQASQQPHNNGHIENKVVELEDLSVKARLAKKIKMEQGLSLAKQDTYPMVTTQTVQPAHNTTLDTQDTYRKCTTAIISQPPVTPPKPGKQEFGNLRNLLSTAPLGSPAIADVMKTSVHPQPIPGPEGGQATPTGTPQLPKSVAQLKIDHTLADSYMRNWRQTGRFQCTFCPYSSVTKNYLFRHWLVNHNQESAYQCAYCDFRATYKDSITRHQSINHREAERHILVDAVMETSIMGLFENLFGLDLGRSGVRKHLPSSSEGPDEEHGYSVEDANLSQDQLEESHPESLSSSHISTVVRLTATNIAAQFIPATSTAQPHLAAAGTEGQYLPSYSLPLSYPTQLQTACTTSPAVSHISDRSPGTVSIVRTTGETQTIKQESEVMDYEEASKDNHQSQPVVSDSNLDSSINIPVVVTPSHPGLVPTDPALRSILDSRRSDGGSRAMDLRLPATQTNLVPLDHLRAEQNPSHSCEISEASRS